MITPLPPPPPLPGDMLPPPTGDAATLLLNAWDAAAADIVDVAVRLARRGDIGALKLILDRICPMPRGRLVNIERLPRVETLADVPKAHARLVELVARGEITPGEAEQLSATLDRYVSATAAVDHEARLAAIEQSIADAAHK